MILRDAVNVCSELTGVSKKQVDRILRKYLELILMEIALTSKASTVFGEITVDKFDNLKILTQSDEFLSILKSIDDENQKETYQEILSFIQKL